MIPNDKLPIFVPHVYANPTAVVIVEYDIEIETGTLTLSTWTIGPSFDEAVSTWKGLRSSRAHPNARFKCTARAREDCTAPEDAVWKARAFRGPGRNGTEEMAPEHTRVIEQVARGMQ